MSLKLSTGLRNKMLDTNSLDALLNGGKLYIFAGPVPASADDALTVPATHQLLCTITLSGGASGINFDTAASGGTLSKAPAETWSGTNAAGGTATFYRHCESGDNGQGASTTLSRLQGAIGTSGQEMNLSSVTLTNGAVQTIDYYSVSLPTL
jgi:hypothetical protein